MEQNTLGVVLSYYREKYGFSLERISSGICSVATMSRVEGGAREIDSLMAEALLGRIGKEVTQFELMLNDEDYAMWQRREVIYGLLEKENYCEAQEELKAYKNCIDETQHLHRQWYLYWSAKIKAALGQDKNEICKLAAKALNLTIPDLNDKGEQLYNPMEIRLILLLIQSEYSGWDISVETELERLYDYVERFYSEGLHENLGVEILLLLVEFAEKQTDDDKILLYAEKAVAFIAKGRGIQHIADLHFRRARAIERKFRQSELWGEQQKACKETCLMAYCTAQLMEETELLGRIERYCEEKLEWQITKQGILFD